MLTVQKNYSNGLVKGAWKSDEELDEKDDIET